MTDLLYLDNALCLDFINPQQNHCLFYQSPANIMHILEITCKEIVYIGYQSWEGMYIYLLGMKFT